MKNYEPDLSLMSDDLRIHHITAIFVFVATLILYLASIAPTTSFWDCGEFIACSYSLGVPHPPGAPFYLILGRLFSMLPLIPDVGLKVNLLSALVSALTIMLTYLTIVRLLRRWRGFEKDMTDKIVIYGSGMVGAMSFAASHSFWWNAVEAEVYAISMFFTALVVWLAIKWMDESEDPNAVKYLFLIAYFVGLSTGVHLLNVLALSPIVLLVYFHKYPFSWKGLVIAIAISFFAILIVYPGIVAGIPNLLSKGIFALIIPIVIGLGLLFWSVRNRKNIISLILFSSFLVLIGYSTYTFIYVRSNLDPEINENQPDTVARLISYLNREQYGSAGPVEMQEINPAYKRNLKQGGAKFISLSSNKILRFNILERNAPMWEYQIKKMYFRYLSWQFFIGDLGQPFIIPFILGIMGMVWHFMRDWRRGSVIMLLFFMTGLAIVFYLNQDDPQPRERDYAYVGSYFAFALWVGIGVSALFELMEDYLKKKSASAKKLVAYGTVILSLGLVPVNMIVQGYHSHDRSGNYVAWDYSHNLLETCAPNAMLFTNGDNDTFPLWYLQVVEGIRRDVRVVNLSLLNTEWYIKQLKNKEPKQPITLTDEFIDKKLCAHTDESLLLRYWPKGKQKWQVERPDGSIMSWNVPAAMYINTGTPGEEPGKPNFLRIQDVMILHLIQANKWERPIYFAVTVSTANLVGLSRYMQMEGLAFRLHPQLMPPVDEEILRKNMFETYADNYRNLGDPDVYLFPNVVKLLQNYRSGFIQLVYEYYSKLNPSAPPMPSGIPDEQWGERFEELNLREKALYTLRKMEEVIPESVIPLHNKEVELQLGRIYYDLGAQDEGNARLDGMIDEDDNSIDSKLQAAYYYNEYGNNPEKMEKVIKEVLSSNPSVEQMFNIAALYDRAQKKDKLVEILNMINTRAGLTVREQIDLATYYYTSDNLDKSRSIFERLAENNPHDGAVMGGLLEVYRTMKDTQKTVGLLEKWLAINPGDNRAQELLKEWKKP